MGKFTGLSVGTTVWVNLLRGIVSGIVLVILLLITKGKIPGISVGTMLLIAPVVVPCVMLILVPAYWFASFFGIGGIISFIAGLFLLPGDPIMYALHKLKPSLVPVKKYSFFEFSLFMLIYKGDLPEETKAEKPNSSDTTSSCPHAGRYLAKADLFALGSSWKNAEVMMIIQTDWHVTDKNGNKIGWIGTDGAIRNQAQMGDVKPHEILAPMSGDIIAKVINTGIWVDNEKIAEIDNWA